MAAASDINLPVAVVAALLVAIMSRLPTGLGVGPLIALVLAWIFTVGMLGELGGRTEVLGQSGDGQS